MKLQYRHRNCDKAFYPATFAYDLPPPVAFEKMFHQGEPVINFFFGMTLVHPDDQYCKATGRHYAQEALSMTEFKVEKIILEEDRAKYFLTSGEFFDNKVLTLKVSVDFDLMKTRLEWIELNDTTFGSPLS